MSVNVGVHILHEMGELGFMRLQDCVYKWTAFAEAGTRSGERLTFASLMPPSSHHHTGLKRFQRRGLKAPSQMVCDGLPDLSSVVSNPGLRLNGELLWKGVFREAFLPALTQLETTLAEKEVRKWTRRQMCLCLRCWNRCSGPALGATIQKTHWT